MLIPPGYLSLASPLSPALRGRTPTKGREMIDIPGCYRTEYRLMSVL